MLSRLRNLVTPTGAACLAAMVLLMARVLPAQEGGAAAAKADLAAGQDAIALRYQRFEKTLLALAESMRKTDPDRAELLRRAVQKSKDERISLQMEKLVELLREEQLGDAAERRVVDLDTLQNGFSFNNPNGSPILHAAGFSTFPRQVDEVLLQFIQPTVNRRTPWALHLFMCR